MPATTSASTAAGKGLLARAAPLLAYPGGAWLATRLEGARLRRSSLPGVAVLAYHGVRPDGLPAGAMMFEGLHVRTAVLEAHCAALARYCHPISLDDWRRAVDGGRPLPPRPVLVTFDDGYRTVLTEALPVLERHGVPAVVHVCTEPVARRERFWYDAVASAEGEEAVARLKAVPAAVWADAVARYARGVADDDPHAPLRPDDVGRLAAHPLIEVGGHTATHLILARADAARQREEIEACAAALRAWTGQPMRAFAYPNGRPRVDFTEQSRALVAGAGVDHAFTTDERFADPQGDPLMHPRFMVTASLLAPILLRRLRRTWR